MVVAARLATEASAGVSSAIRRGSRQSVTQQTEPYRMSQPKADEKFGLGLRTRTPQAYPLRYAEEADGA